MAEAFIEIFKTPFLWQSLGLITAISLFISPVLYNGDYRMASKSIVIVGGYGFFVGLLNFFHLCWGERCGHQVWLQTVVLSLLVGLAYILGLFLGVYIHNKSKKKFNK